MSITDKIREVALALTLWASKSQREEVIVIRPAEALLNLEVLDFQLGSRPGGLSGINALDSWASDNRAPLLSAFGQDKGISGEVGETNARLYPSEHLTALEVAGRLSDDETVAQNHNFGTFFSAKADDEGSFSKAEASLPLKGPNSSSVLRLFHEGVKTPLNRVLSALCGTEIDLVQYGLSLMNAKKAAFFTGADSSRVDLKIVIADHSKPLFYNEQRQLNRYASATGGDGNMVFSWSSAKRNDVQGQIRGFFINALTWLGAMFKGVGVGDDVYLTPEGTFTDDPTKGERIFLADLNVIKGRGKEHPAYIEAKNHGGDYAHPVVISQQLYAWFIRQAKTAEDHCGAQAESFQGTPFFPANLEGTEEGAVYNRVDAGVIVENLQAKICKVDEKTEALANECLEQVGIDLTQFTLPNGRIPYRALLESVTKDLERVASAGTFRKGQLLKVWGNQLTPCGVVLMDEAQMGYNHLLDLPKAEKLREEFETSAVSFFESEYYRQGYALFGRLVGHKRTPQLSPFGISTSRALCHADLKAFAKALANSQNEWVCTEGYELNTWETAQELLLIHNLRVADRRLDTIEGGMSKQVPFEQNGGIPNEWFVRLMEWEYSLEAANITSFFVCNPADGRDRNEDHDGDDTVCCPSRFVVDKYVKVEAFWARMAYPFVNELPKESKMDWRHDRLRQRLPNADGKLELTTNVKGMSLEEMFPSIEWCTPERIAQICHTTMAEAQGPTGMFSNVAADLFARIRWMKCPSGRANRHGRLIVPTPATMKIFKLWVFYCVGVQLSIDWQKRAYRLFLLMYWEKVVDALLEKGWAGLESFAGIIPEDGWSDQESLYGDKAQLGANWCFNASIVYLFAQEELDVEVCLWKFKRGSLEFPAPSSVIMTEMEKLPMTRFRAVNEAFHRKGGIREQFGSAVGYVEKIAKVIKDKTDKNDLVALVPGAFAYLASETLKAGDDGDLAKVPATYRGSLLLRGMGFNQEAQDRLLEGYSAKSSELGDTEWNFRDLLVAAAHGAKGREVDAFQILVAYYVSQKETGDQEKEMAAFGAKYTDAFLRGICTKADADVEIPFVYDEGYDLLYRCMDRDLLPHWENVAFSGRDRIKEVINPIAAKAVEVAGDDHSPITLAKIALNGLLKVVTAAEAYSLRQERYKIGGYPVRSFRYAALLPSEEYQLELKCLPENVKKYHVREAEDGRLYAINGGKAREKTTHLTNASTAHQWGSAVSNDDPIRKAYLALTKGRGFSVEPNWAKAYAMATRLLDADQSLLIKCRTLTGHGGYFTADLFDAAIDLAHGKVWSSDEIDGEVEGGLVQAVNLLRGCSAEQICQGEREANGYVTKVFFRDELLEGKAGMIDFEAHDEGAQKWVNDMFGFTPIPQALSCVLEEETLEGYDAFIKLVGDLLLCVAVEDYITLTETVSDARWEEYRDAKNWVEDQIEQYNLPLKEGFAKKIYWFTAMASDTPLAFKKGRLARLQATMRAYMRLGV